MFDIIITAYNDHDKVLKSLASIAMQIKKDVANIYIVNNGSSKDYKNEINIFKNDLNIKELKIKEKKSLGYARNYAIDNCDGDYVIFFNAGEEFYNCYALSALYEQINNNYDVICGEYYLYYGDINNMFLIEKPDDYSEIYAKAYKREFLINNNIRFNYSKECETDSFQGLVNSLTQNQMIINEIIGVIYPINRDYNEQLDYNINFLHNRLWLVHELLRRNADSDYILNVFINSYLYIFHEVFSKIDDFRYRKFFKYCSKFEKDYDKYGNDINEDYIKDIMMNYYSITDIQAQYMLYDFNNFRKKFYEKDV